MSDTHPAVFRRAVAALNGGPSDERIVSLVADQAHHLKAELIAVHVVEIDWTLPLDADIASRSEEVQRVLDTAEEVAEESKMVLEPVLLQARDVGAAIVDEASERGADLLVVGSPIASDSVANSPSAGPSRTSCRTHHVRSGSCATRSPRSDSEDRHRGMRPSRGRHRRDL